MVKRIIFLLLILLNLCIASTALAYSEDIGAIDREINSGSE